MTRVPVCRRLLAAAGALVAVVLVVGTTANPTTASWTDGAVFAAQATSGTWDSGHTCEVVSVSTGEVVGSCAVDSVTIGDRWPQGMRFNVALTSFEPSADVQARVTVDMSKVSTEWDWSAGTVQMDNAWSSTWAAPILTFTTMPWHTSPFGGTFYLNG